MMYSVKLSPSADKFLKKLDKYQEKRIKSRLKLLKCEDPFHYLEHFEGADCYKFRMGEYRALVEKVKPIIYNL